MKNAQLASLYFDTALAYMGASGDISKLVSKLHGLELLMDARVGEPTRIALWVMAVDEYNRYCEEAFDAGYSEAYESFEGWAAEESRF